MKKDNARAKQWLHKLDPEPRMEGFITEAGWDLLKEYMTDASYNSLIEKLEAGIELKKVEINKQIDDQKINMDKNKIK